MIDQQKLDEMLERYKALPANQAIEVDGTWYSAGEVVTALQALRTGETVTDPVVKALMEILPLALALGGGEVFTGTIPIIGGGSPEMFFPKGKVTVTHQGDPVNGLPMPVIHLDPAIQDGCITHLSLSPEEYERIKREWEALYGDEPRRTLKIKGDWTE